MRVAPQTFCFGWLDLDDDDQRRAKDFHLFCRDIVHWNLPSNPVDLEQHEGRINRYDGLSIRRNLERDFPLNILRVQPGENLWNALFRILTEKSHGNGRSKHGLFPHWIYRSQAGHGADMADQSIIRRHLLFYAGSRDRQHYIELKKTLALYRLVFGQPRQQDILEQVLAQRPNQEPDDLNKSLDKYMINISPFGPPQAAYSAKVQATAGKVPTDVRRTIKDSWTLGITPES
jgi:hypothetical protein